MTDVVQAPNQTFSTTVSQIDFNIESDTQFSQSLHFYETQKVASDLTGNTYELRLSYLNQVLALTKALPITANTIGIELTSIELSALNAKEFIVEVYKTQAGSTSKISEGKLTIT